MGRKAKQEWVYEWPGYCAVQCKATRHYKQSVPIWEKDREGTRGPERPGYRQALPVPRCQPWSLSSWPGCAGRAPWGTWVQRQGRERARCSEWLQGLWRLLLDQRQGDGRAGQAGTLRSSTRKQAGERTAGGWCGDMGRNFSVLKGESKPRFIFSQAGKAEAGTGGKSRNTTEGGSTGRTPQNRCGNVSPAQDVGRRESGQGQAHRSLWRRKSKEKRTWEPQFLRKDKVFPWGKQSRGNMRRGTKFRNSHNREKQNKQF